MERVKPFNSSAATPLPEEKPFEREYVDYVRSKKEQVTQEKRRPLQFVAVDEKMVRIKEIVDQIANANVSVLITGESGTGKEVIARMIHAASNRNNEKFVAINCAAVPANLLESELFGHEKGSFTGAHQRHLGKFEQANSGTLLLDEITETDVGIQAKLLRALQEKEIERVGGQGPVKVDARIIATSNRDVVAAVKKSEFREDLYYRLNVIKLVIPPLRERVADVVALSQFFLEKYRVEYDRPNLVLSEDAIQKLKKYSWPGNVRELQNVIQRAILMSQGTMIMANDIPVNTKVNVNDSLDWIEALPLGRPMREVETHFIIETLKYHNGNRTHAARTLGISLRTLRNKINEFTAAGYEVPAPTIGKAL